MDFKINNCQQGLSRLFRSVLTFLYFVTTMLLFTSGPGCKKIELHQTATITITGIAQNQSGHSLSGVKITINNQQVLTGQNGYFSFKNLATGSERVVIHAEKESYFQSGKTLLVKNDGQYSVRISLINKNLIDEFQTAAGYSNTVGKVKLNFPPNALRTKDGSSYSGTCRIAVSYLSPDNERLTRLIPGILLGENDKGEEKVLATYGMVAVEMETPNGEVLEIIPGKEVVMSIPITPDQLANAPNQIPLWYFDTEKGIRIEEGVAFKKDGFYEGEVSHFTFWNYDLPFDFVKLSGRILIENVAVEGASIKIKTIDNQAVCSGVYLNLGGTFEGYIPINQSLILTVYDLCDGQIHEQVIGPFSADTQMDDILVTNNGTSFLHLKAKLVDCFGNPVRYGVMANYSIIDGSQFVTFNTISDENGNVELITYCLNQTQLNLRFFDPVQGEASVLMAVNVPPLEVDLGEIVVCGDGFEAFSFFSWGIPYGGENVGISAIIDGSSLIVTAYDSIQQEIFYLKVMNNGTSGTFPAVEKFTAAPFSALNTPSAPDNIQVSVNIEQSRVAVGKPVSGTFTGGITDSDGSVHGLEGKFYAIRQE